MRPQYDIGPQAGVTLKAWTPKTNRSQGNIRNTWLPHSDFGDPDCCGLFFPVDRGDQADLTCNECGLFTRRSPRVSCG
jgi:hypothetical protein